MFNRLLIAGLLIAGACATIGNAVEISDKPEYKTGKEIRRFYKGTVEFLQDGEAILHLGVKDDFPRFKHGMIYCSRVDGQDIANLWLNNRQVKLKWVVDEFKAKPGSPHTVGTLKSWSPR